MAIEKQCGGDTPQCSTWEDPDSDDSIAKCCPEGKLNLDEDGNCID